MRLSVEAAARGSRGGQVEALARAGRAELPCPIPSLLLLPLLLPIPLPLSFTPTTPATGIPLPPHAPTPLGLGVLPRPGDPLVMARHAPNPRRRLGKDELLNLVGA